MPFGGHDLGLGLSSRVWGGSFVNGFFSLVMELMLRTLEDFPLGRCKEIITGLTMWSCNYEAERGHFGFLVRLSVI